MAEENVGWRIVKPCGEQPNRQENQNAGKIWYLVQHWHGDCKSVGVLKYKCIEKVCKKGRNDVFKYC